MAPGSSVMMIDVDIKSEKGTKNYCPDLPEAPVFRPTEDQFKDPLKFFASVYEKVQEFGICKIVPPKSWSPPVSFNPDNFEFTPRLQSLPFLDAKNRLRTIFFETLSMFWEMYDRKVKNNITAGKGKHVDLADLHYLVEDERETRKLEEDQEGLEFWTVIANKLGHDSKIATRLQQIYSGVIAPMNDFIKLIKNEVKLQEDKSEPATKKIKMCSSSKNSMKTMMSMRSKEDDDTPYLEHLNTAVITDEQRCKNCEASVKDDCIKTIACQVCYFTFHVSCVDPCPVAEIKKVDKISSTKLFKHYICKACTAYRLCSGPLNSVGFQDYNRSFKLIQFEDYANEAKKHHFKIESQMDYDPPISPRVIENEFWKHILTEKYLDFDVLYGADLSSEKYGSGFPVETAEEKQSEQMLPTFGAEIEIRNRKQYLQSKWNLNNLPHLKASLLKYIGSDVSGMTKPWIYVGMIFSSFCWHVEDHWTPSINYHHFGAPKIWYGVGSHQAEQFDNRVKELAPKLLKLQPALLHHLNAMIHPSDLIAGGVRVCRTDQHEGEFIITSSRGYHAGLNCGFNCNEAVNFATSDWLRYGYESIQHYERIARTNVFSHQEILCKMAQDAETLSLEEAEEVLVQLSIMVSEEKKLMDEIRELAIRSKRRVIFEDFKEDDERTCFKCNKTLYFSAFRCGTGCRSKLKPRLQQSCGKHFKSLCQCPVSRRQLLFRYTLEEIEALSLKVYQRVVDLKGHEEEDGKAYPGNDTVL